MVKTADVKHELDRHLRELHLPTVRECYEAIAQRAEAETLSYERYLLELVERESEERRQRRVARLLRQSRLPLEKNLSTFRTMPSENEMFYGTIQKGLDKWNAAFFCGSAAVLRRSALDRLAASPACPSPRIARRRSISAKASSYETSR